MKKTPPYDVYGVFTVQEEIGSSAGQMCRQCVLILILALGLDTTIAFDLPGAAKHEMITELGAGTAIKIMDASN